ncbi:hypothetical protein MHUMG1_04489 [Metarhizium humberi]|uniref:TauD/TfdA-like domain-containing protein n=1 Tax=Metarhizium humberi TaxID=2596975 RepID=A0A9P8MD59_9HYPO|nr:hypothetical protein MHUMG1_04489 [Metarhizium humberi]
MNIRTRLPNLVIETVRKQFPGLNKGLICLNNGSGALVHKGVMESRIDVRERAAQYVKLASFMNADPDEIEIAELVHTVPGALICVDGVAWAPHRPIDVRKLNVDFYVFSWYKVFGPHIAQVYARRNVQQRYLTSLNHYFLDSSSLAVKLGLGNSCIELEHALVPIINYLVDEVGWDSIIAYEEVITRYLLDYLTANPDLYTVYGSRTSDPKTRVALISFSVNGLTSDKVANEIHEKSNCRLLTGDCWSPRTVHDILGLADDGIIRTSLTHYNTLDEMKIFTKKLDQVGLGTGEIRIFIYFYPGILLLPHCYTMTLSHDHDLRGSAGDSSSVREPLKLRGLLDGYKSYNVTPVIGTEFPDANVVEWMKDANSDEILRDLAVTISRRGVVFFRAQTDLTDELQKELALRLGRLTGKPESSTLHIHPLANFNADRDPHLNIITTDQATNPAEDLWKNRPADIRNSWHTDAGYEPNPPDYSILKLIKLPKTGGGMPRRLAPFHAPFYIVLTVPCIDTMWASSCEIYDKVSPAYRKFLEGLTADFSQSRLPNVAAAKGFELYSKPRGSPNNIGTSLRAVHPVVRTNPVTGWKSLFAVGNHVERINDVTSDESKRLLDWFLQLIVEEHDCQLRHRWENPYDIAIWDNRSVYHTAIFDYAGLGARTGHRAVGIGERPYFNPSSKTRREALAEE